MQYYMLDKRDISNVHGIVDAKDVMRELGITNAQFHKMLRNEEIYNGCILVPVIQDSGRELPTSESEELYQLVCESDSGFRYYITSHIRVVSVSPFDGTEREMLGKEVTKHDCPLELLREQQKYMGLYLSVLEKRALIENIVL